MKKYEFSKTQKEIIEAVEGSIIVSAGAGTGKTNEWHEGRPGDPAGFAGHHGRYYRPLGRIPKADRGSGE